MCESMTDVISDIEALRRQLILVEEQRELCIRKMRAGYDRIALVENQLTLAEYRLVQLQEELKQFKANHPEGAAQRAKEELPYQLGATMMAHGKTGWKLLYLPVTLWLLTYRYRKREKMAEEKHPPVLAYRDYDKALAVHQHLTWKLGATWLTHARCPLHWLFMPIFLLITYLSHRRLRHRK